MRSRRSDGPRHDRKVVVMDTRTKVGFVGAAGALIILYFASGGPIPLYSIYQEQLDLSNGQLSMISMYYLLGTVIPLMFLPRISDHLGRRPVTVMILLISISGCITFAYVSSPEMLMAGRLIQGIVSGLGSSTVAAYVVDLASDLPRWVGPTITSSAPTLGLSLGCFVSGGVTNYTSVTSESYFEMVAVVVCVFIVLVFFARETMPRKPGLARSLRPRFVLPPNSLRLYAASSMAFVATWALGGFAQSFSSTIVSEQFGIHDSFVAAAVYTALLLPNVVGSFFAKRFEVRQAQRWGFGMFTLCAVLMLVSLEFLDSLALYIVFSMVAAVSQGVAFTAGVTEILGRATKEQRSGTFSLIYLTSYGGAAIPNLVVGLLPGEYSLFTILTGYVVLVVVMFAIMLVLSAKPYPKAEAREVARTEGS